MMFDGRYSFEVPTPEQLVSQIPTPLEIETITKEKRIVIGRMVDALSNSKTTLTIGYLMAGYFPPGYYAIDSYYEQYVSIVADVRPLFESRGWAVYINRAFDMRGNLTAETNITIQPKPNDNEVLIDRGEE
jgi:hypothetical protein